MPFSMTGDPHIIIEIKGPGSKLEDHFNQLYRYFNSLRKAKFAILTNGIVFQFYSDLDELNILDKTPFLTIDLENLKEPAMAELEKFHKQKYDKEIILSTANDLKYTTQIKEYLSQQFKKPDEDFLKFILRNVYTGKLMSSVLERFEPIVKKSMTLFINEIVSDKIKSALDGVRSEEIKGVVEEAEVKEEKELQEEEQEVKKTKESETTQEELEAYYLVKFLLKDTVGDSHTIDYKDTLSYFAVMIDNNIRNWICRFYFDRSIKRIRFHGEDKIDIENIQDIEKYKDKLIDLANNVIENSSPVTAFTPAPPLADEAKWYGLDELIEANTAGTKPQKVRLPDGTEKLLKKWVEIVEYTVQWLYDKSKLSKKHSPIPDYSGKNRYIINTEPVHLSGKQYKGIINIGDLYIETNYASENHLRNIREIFKAIGEKPNIKIYV